MDLVDIENRFNKGELVTGDKFWLACYTYRHISVSNLTHIPPTEVVISRTTETLTGKMNIIYMAKGRSVCFNPVGKSGKILNKKIYGYAYDYGDTFISTDKDEVVKAYIKQCEEVERQAQSALNAITARYMEIIEKSQKYKTSV
jgi:hypothetical protein